MRVLLRCTWRDHTKSVRITRKLRISLSKETRILDLCSPFGFLRWKMKFRISQGLAWAKLKKQAWGALTNSTPTPVKIWSSPQLQLCGSIDWLDPQPIEFCFGGEEMNKATCSAVLLFAFFLISSQARSILSRKPQPLSSFKIDTNSTHPLSTVTKINSTLTAATPSATTTGTQVWIFYPARYVWLQRERE